MTQQNAVHLFFSQVQIVKTDRDCAEFRPWKFRTRIDSEENAMPKRRTLLDILESVCLALKETGEQSQLANYGLATVATRRARHSRAASTPRTRGRKPRELPFEDIHHMRRRKLTWADIRDRLEAGGVRISVGRLFTRYQIWKKSRTGCRVTKTVTRS